MKVNVKTKIVDCKIDILDVEKVEIDFIIEGLEHLLREYMIRREQPDERHEKIEKILKSLNQF